jgi:hypothetical protein
MASDLVAKVQGKIAQESSDFYSLPADLPEEHLHLAMAHAAIKAVAEWITDSV